MLIPLKTRSFLSMLKTKGRNLGIKGHTEPFELHTSYGTKRARGFFRISANESKLLITVIFRDKCDAKNGLFKPLSHIITEVTLFF